MSAQPVRRLAPAELAAGTWTAVPDACTAGFDVRDKLVTTVHGTFPVTGGTVLTEAGGTVTSARMELDVAGVATGNVRRDRDLHKPHFLDAAGHPRILVEAGRTTPSESGWTVRARLSARGASCPLELQVAITSADDERVRVRMTGRLDRSELGIKAPVFIIGRYLEIEVDALFERT